MIKDFAKKIDYPIPEKLQGFVAAFILGETKEPGHFNIPIFPTGFPLLVHIYGDKPTFSIDGEPYQTRSRLVVAGQICNAHINFELKGIFGQVGVILYPTALYYLFHKAGENFNNMWTDFENASPVASSKLTLELKDCSSITQRISLLLNFLEHLADKRLPAIDWLENSVLKIFSEGGKIGQNELIENSGVSSRHFRRVFKKAIGVSPKYFCKVIQLNTVFELLNNSETEKMHHLALECGYFDQAHFIHDFQRMIGVSPTHFLNGEHAYIKTYMGRKEML